MRREVACLCMALLMACGGTGVNGRPIGGADGGGAGPESGTPASPNGPAPADAGAAILDGGARDSSAALDLSSTSSGGLRIVSFTSTLPKMTSSQAVELDVVATDSAGLGQIAGGKLVDESGATYGDFMPSAEGVPPGSWLLTLDWAAIGAARPLQFDPPGVTRIFTAEMFDNLGATATASLTIQFYCGDHGDEAACDGVCSALDTEFNCGACGVTCDNNQECVNGTCGCATPTALCGGWCDSLSDDPHNCGACGNDCSAVSGATSHCVQGACVCQNGGAQCGDKCVDLSSDLGNCGQCGQACSGKNGFAPACTSGVCTLTVPSSTRQTCGSLCAAQGLICDPNPNGGTAHFSSIGATVSIGCLDTPPADFDNNTVWPFLSVDCDCTP